MQHPRCTSRSPNASWNTPHCSSSSSPGCCRPGGSSGDGRGGGFANAAAGAVSIPVSIVGVQSGDRKCGNVGDVPVSRVCDGEGRDERRRRHRQQGRRVPATSSAKVSVSEPPAIPAALSVVAPAVRSTTVSTETVQGLRPPPGSGVTVRDARPSVSRVLLR